MAYLFQSGTLRADNFRYQLEADTGAINSTGSITFGAGNDASVYYNDASGLVLDTKSGKKVDLSAAGTRLAFADSTGFTIEDTLSLFIDTSEVLSETTLGATVTGSSLTSLGTIASLVATTADINAGTVDAVIGGTTPAAGSFTTISGSSTLIVDGSGSFNNGVTFKAGTDITLGVSGDTALDVAADGLYFADATDGFVKTIAIGSFLTDIAGSGLSVVSNQLEAAGGAETVNDPIGNENATLLVGMNWGTSSFNANRVWTLPACSTLNKGDVLRIKAPTLGGYTLTVSPNAVDAIDDLADDVDVELGSDNSSISLMVVSGSGIGLIWKII